MDREVDRMIWIVIAFFLGFLFGWFLNAVISQEDDE